MLFVKTTPTTTTATITTTKTINLNVVKHALTNSICGAIKQNQSEVGQIQFSFFN